jgi:hypothetical protein
MHAEERLYPTPPYGPHGWQRPAAQGGRRLQNPAQMGVGAPIVPGGLRTPAASPGSEGTWIRSCENVGLGRYCTSRCDSAHSAHRAHHTRVRRHRPPSNLGLLGRRGTPTRQLDLRPRGRGRGPHGRGYCHCKNGYSSVRLSRRWWWSKPSRFELKAFGLVKILATALLGGSDCTCRHGKQNLPFERRKRQLETRYRDVY